MKLFQIINDDCLNGLKLIPDSSVDSIVTDPPYGLSFMNKGWDCDVPSVDIWRECLRVLKPGGHLLAFAGTRTQHRMAVNIEDAGFEIRDMIAWVYGSGFPKSLDISKAIDKTEGIWRGRAGALKSKNTAMHGGNYVINPKGSPVTEAAKEWNGWGTALKPALEPITVARKPFPGTVADNVLKYGTGGLNIDGCRVALEGEEPPTGSAKRVFAKNEFATYSNYGDNKQTPEEGRFPANFIHDGSDEVTALFPHTKSGGIKKDSSAATTKTAYSKYEKRSLVSHEDEGSAARFFYCAKTSPAERVAGVSKNHHPTVKPLALMRYLCRLVTKPGGLVVDPFAGSGSTLCAAVLEGFDVIGCERDTTEGYVDIVNGRATHHGGQPFDLIDMLNLIY